MDMDPRGKGRAGDGRYPPSMAADASWLKDHVRDIPDYPRTGVTFRDITPLLGDPDAFRFAVDAIADRFSGVDIDRVIGIEARGFILAAPLAYRRGASFVPIRKAGKLPWAVAREEYALEYGTDKLEIHRDAVHPGEQVLIVDDVLATGGTAAAAVRLVEGLGAEVVGLGFAIELLDLGGRDNLKTYEVESLITY
jgi:adenine phosphoribosyltransferase